MAFKQVFTKLMPWSMQKKFDEYLASKVTVWEEDKAFKFKEVKTFDVETAKGITAQKLGAEEQKKMINYEKLKKEEDLEEAIILDGIIKDLIETKIAY